MTCEFFGNLKNTAPNARLPSFDALAREEEQRGPQSVREKEMERECV